MYQYLQIVLLQSLQVHVLRVNCQGLCKEIYVCLLFLNHSWVPLWTLGFWHFWFLFGYSSWIYEVLANDRFFINGGWRRSHNYLFLSFSRWTWLWFLLWIEIFIKIFLLFLNNCFCLLSDKGRLLITISNRTMQNHFMIIVWSCFHINNIPLTLLANFINISFDLLVIRCNLLSDLTLQSFNLSLH